MIHGKLRPTVKNFRLHPFNPATESHMLFVLMCLYLPGSSVPLPSSHSLHLQAHSVLSPLILALPFKVLDSFPYITLLPLQNLLSFYVVVLVALFFSLFLFLFCVFLCPFFPLPLQCDFCWVWNNASLLRLILPRNVVLSVYCLSYFVLFLLILLLFNIYWYCPLARVCIKGSCLDKLKKRIKIRLKSWYGLVIIKLNI